MEATSIGVGLLGCGFMAKAHLNALRQVHRFFPGRLKPRVGEICGTTTGKPRN